MKVLLDTNIIIDRESYNTKNYTISNLYLWMERLGCKKVIHPFTLKEISKYKNPAFNEALMIKVGSYLVLSSSEDYTPEFLEIVGKFRQDENSIIDNALLFQVVIGRVDVLITEDRQMLQKALKLQIEKKVFSINRFITKATEEHPELLEYKILAVKKRKFGDVSLKDPFFDSFKQDYKDFSNWYNYRCDKEAYVCEINKQIVGFLYLKVEDKDENYSDILPIFEKKKRLKIGTFKVESTGFRLGERFLKIIFDNAIEQKVDEIYVTLFEKNLALRRLRELLERWGFIKHGTKISTSGIEDVYVKKIGEYDSRLSPKSNYPNLQPASHKFILPIFAQYHTSLFPDAILKNESMDLYMDNLAHRYALQKVYVSAASSDNVNPGDLVYIYRTGETIPKKYSSVLTTIAIVDEIIIASSINEYLVECQNRSVFSENELRTLWPRYNKIIKLLFYKTLSKKIILDELYRMGIVSFPEGPRPFHCLTNEEFYNILSESNTVL